MLRITLRIILRIFVAQLRWSTRQHSQPREASYSSNIRGTENKVTPQSTTKKTLKLLPTIDAVRMHVHVVQV